MALLILMGAACVRPAHVSPGQMSALRETPEEALSVCKLLGRFVGTSALPGEQGLLQAREEARARAAEAGATNFFYASESPMPDETSVAVKGYDCGKQP